MFGMIINNISDLVIKVKLFWCASEYLFVFSYDNKNQQLIFQII